MSSAHPTTVSSGYERSSLTVVVREMALGRQEAMGRLYDATSPLVYGCLLRILANAQDAEAVTLEVYLRAWRSAASYSPEQGSVQAWLLTLAHACTAVGRTRVTLQEGQ
jgi:RNA polymerase sigma-70 factor, ECF subfamily